MLLPSARRGIFAGGKLSRQGLIEGEPRAGTPESDLGRKVMLRFYGTWRRMLWIVVSILAGVGTIHASEVDALTISQNIQRLHMPYGTILDPVFASSDPSSPGYSDLVGYTRAGDSAIWTGHYLAAEAFRYKVTRSPDALANASKALQGIQSLLDITGSDVLARCLVPTNSPYASSIQQQEAGNGIYYNNLGGQSYFWIGNTSRDQYSGVVFGLSVAYDMIDDTNLRGLIEQDLTRILIYLLVHNWNVVMPDGKVSTTFVFRPDQQLSFLQAGRKVNPQFFTVVYAIYRAVYAPFVTVPVFIDSLDDHNHYFKFNLDYINLYDLIRLEEDGSPYKAFYMTAYNILRARTQSHGNAHFNMIDRGLKAPDSVRDTETVTLLNLWLLRPRRDYFVDWRGKFPACGSDRSCIPIPVNERVNTDFLWQRSPFLLFGGGAGLVETAAIDYILPYWMARFYGLPQ
jgi:hypothetical protein